MRQVLLEEVACREVDRDLQLDAETIQRLDALKPPPETYPTSLLTSQFFHTMMLGQHHAELLSP